MSITLDEFKEELQTDHGFEPYTGNDIILYCAFQKLHERGKIVVNVMDEITIYICAKYSPLTSAFIIHGLMPLQSLDIINDLFKNRCYFEGRIGSSYLSRTNWQPLENPLPPPKENLYLDQAHDIAQTVYPKDYLKN